MIEFSIQLFLRFLFARALLIFAPEHELKLFVTIMLEIKWGSPRKGKQMKVVKDLKDVLSAYYRKYEKIQAEIEKARKLYQPDVAKEQIERIEADFRNEKGAALEEISNLRDRAVTQIISWGNLDGTKIDEGDSRLLEYDLSREQFERIVEKNKGNGTMCFILSQYAEKQNKKAREEDPEAFFPAGYLDAGIVPTVKGKVEALDYFVNGALSLINTMDDPVNFWPGSSVLGESIRKFGEPTAINETYLSMLEV